MHKKPCHFCTYSPPPPPLTVLFLEHKRWMGDTHWKKVRNSGTYSEINRAGSIRKCKRGQRVSWDWINYGWISPIIIILITRMTFWGQYYILHHKGMNYLKMPGYVCILTLSLSPCNCTVTGTQYASFILFTSLEV